MKNSCTLLLLSALSTAPGLLLAQNPLPPPGPDYSAPAAIENPVSPNKGPISGMVRFPPGEDNTTPVLVRLESETGFLLDQAWTRKSGRFEFYQVACGSYFLVINVVGYKPLRRPVEHSYEPLEGVALYLVPDERTASSASGSGVSQEQFPIPEKARKEYKQGLKAIAEKKTERGIEHFRKAIELFPDFDDAYVQLALTFLKQGAYEDARTAAKSAIARNEKNARAYALLGVASREQKQPQEAVKALEESVRLEENSWFSHFELGKTYLEQQQLDTAYSHLARAHELNRSTPTVHLNLYNVLILRNEFAAAAAELDDFLALFPQDPQAARARQQREALTATQARRQP